MKNRTPEATDQVIESIEFHAIKKIRNITKSEYSPRVKLERIALVLKVIHGHITSTAISNRFKEEIDLEG